MEATIETLNIKVEGEGKSAESTLDRVLKKLERIKEATRGTNGQGTASLNSHYNNLNKTLGSIKEKFNSLSQITDDLSEKTSKCRSTSVAYADAMNDVKEKAEQSQGRFKTLSENIKDAFKTSRPSAFVSVLKTIGRLTLYRMIRSMIKQVTEAFKTGIDDMYQYSKTFNGSYAQSMDQLASANLTFKNSIGAIMAPLIEIVTPWLDTVLTKLVDVNNTIAMVFAHLAGKSTYSKAVRVTTEYAEAANKASDNTEKVTEKVEELKRSLAGLDEITIIGIKNISPISSEIKNPVADKGLDYGSMFVETPVDVAKVERILDTLSEIWEVVKWVGLGIAAWELTNFLLSIGNVLTGLDGIKSKMLGLSLMVVGFGLEFSGAFHIGYGDANLKDYLMSAIGASLGIAGSLLVFGTGPLGWTIGITAAVSVAVAGITVGMNKRLADVVEEAFYDAGGTITISDLAGQFERYCKALTDSYQPTIDLGRQIDDMRNNHLAPTVLEIEGIATAISYSHTVTDEQVDLIKEKFEYLYENSKGALEDTRDLIIQSIAGGFGDTLTALGIDIPEVMALVNGTTADMEKNLEDWHDKVKSISEQFDNHSISVDEYSQQIINLTDDYRNIMGITDPIKDAFADVNQSIKDGINWENEDLKNSAFEKISAASDTALSAVDEMCGDLKSKFELLKQNAESKEDGLAFEKIIAGTEAYRESERKKVATAVSELSEKIQNDLILKMDDVTTRTANEYISNGSFWTKMVHSEESYVAKGLNDYNKNIIKPVLDKLKTEYEKVGAEGNLYASNAATEIINGMFNTSYGIGGGLNTVLAWSPVNGSNTRATGKSFLDAVKDYYGKVGQALPEGLIEGIKEKSGDANTVVGDLANKLLETIKDRDHFNQHSPSKATEEIMKNNLLGFINGIKNNRAAVMSSLDSFLNGMLERMEIFTNRWRSAINDMFGDMAYGWKNADFRSDGSYSYNRLSMGQIQRFAQGGFPEDGFFYANHNELVGQFSNGKTAVANNEQIVEGISAGVSSANEQQNALLREQNRLLRMLLEKDSTIDVATITKAFNRKNQRDGKVTVPVSI